MAETKGLFGDIYVTEDKAVAISVKRYNELIKKEAFYDEIVKHNEVLVLLNYTIKEEEN